MIAVAHCLCRILFAMLRDAHDFDPERAGLGQSIFIFFVPASELDEGWDENGSSKKPCPT